MDSPGLGPGGTTRRFLLSVRDKALGPLGPLGPREFPLPIDFPGLDDQNV
jgi:hypothetical protein